jgi:pimeloyl-ACP methyl ester carboxylesterase
VRLLPLIALLAAAPAVADSVVTAPVSFKATNPLEPFFQRTVRGTLYLPASAPRCNLTVVLLLHGLSYGAWVWDFPIDNSTYSMARALAARGFAAVAVDELGYGSSDHPNGWNLTVTSYGAIAAQIARSLKTGGYQAAAPIAFSKVVLFGHSAGTEMSEIAAGTFGAGDALIASSYSHFPSTGVLLDVLTSDTPRALLSPYVYFAGTAARRAADMYNLAEADSAVVAKDTQLAQLTPSGEILSISPQPSRAALPLITVPVLLIMAEDDVLFPPQALELLLFTAALDKTFYLVPGAGHSFMLHPNAPATQQRVADWLSARLPACPAAP